MSISVTGLGSGLPIDEWVTALVDVKQSSLTTLQNKYTALQSSKNTLSTLKSTYAKLFSTLQTFTDSDLSTSLDLFAKNTATSSNKNVLTATVSNSTPKQTITVNVEQLATSTVAKSSGNPAKWIDENTTLANMASTGIKSGTLSIYIGNTKYTVEVDDDDSLGDIINKINTESDGKATASITDGKFSIASTDGTSIVGIGSNSDTSNISNILALYSSGSTSATSSYSISSMDSSKALTSVNSGFFEYDGEENKTASITEGTFTIGNATFTITSSTTMDEMIARINQSTTAGVTAFYDKVNNKMVLTAKDGGSFNINIKAGTSNFTDVMGLTDGGEIISSAQTLGKNSIVHLNGTKIESYSNTITSESTGIVGLTLNLTSKTTEDSPVTLTIGQDTDSIITSIQGFVDDLNKVISSTDTATASGGDLARESSLNSIRNTLRNLASSASDSGLYKTLAAIGITTGAVGTSTDTNTNQFQIDINKLKEALETDPESVKKLLIGTKDGSTQGLMDKMKTSVSIALDSQKGYFASRADSLNSQMKFLSSKISRQTTQLEKYKEQLETRFAAMDEAISSLNSQYNTMMSLLGLNSSSSSSSSSSS